MLPDGTPFNDIPDQSEARRNDIAQRARDALPEDVIAHRVGDWVFTYHGMDPVSADSQLWIAVASPDPGCNPALSQWPTLNAITADGQMTQTHNWDQQGVLANQNRLRKANGLPPLPHPSTVTHSSPATTGQ